MRVGHRDGKPVFQYPMWDNSRYPFLQYIKHGLKTVEGRVNSVGYKALKKGYFMSLKSKKEELLCEVLYKHQYRSFRQMLMYEGLDNMLPYFRSIDEGVRLYRRFPTARKEKMDGVIAIGVRPISFRRLDEDYWQLCDAEIDRIKEEEAKMALDGKEKA